MKKRVGDLMVAIHYKPNCGRHDRDVKNVPVRECPYYLSIVQEDESIHERYVAVAKSSSSNYLKETRYTYGSLMRLAFSLAKDGYRDEKGAKEPMKVYRESNLLHDGHHRAAVLLALHGPEYLVDVVELDEEVPIHEHRCE